MLDKYIACVLGTDSPSPLSCSSPKPLVSPQQGGPYSLQNHSSK